MESRTDGRKLEVQLGGVCVAQSSTGANYSPACTKLRFVGSTQDEIYTYCKWMCNLHTAVRLLLLFLNVECIYPLVYPCSLAYFVCSVRDLVL